jgi:two-component system chemotaxis sensor kinase CheA
MSSDPYRYFRIEARELLQKLGQGVLALEKGVAAKEQVPELLRLAHTLKGASRVVKQPGIGNLAHAIEDSLAPMRESPEAVPPYRINEILGLLDDIGSRLSSLDPANVSSSQSASPRPPGDEPLETVRVDLDEMDALLEGITETSVQLSALESDLERLARTRELAVRLADEVSGDRRTDGAEGATGHEARTLALVEEIESSLAAIRRGLSLRAEQASRELLDVREKANRLRLVPASAIFLSLERAARDAAHTLQKRVELRTSGGDHRLDPHVLGALRDALLHLVRNSVAHGIEPESERLRSGKEPVGRLEVSVERRGNRVIFACRDDGRGIDVRSIHQAARRKGIIPDSEADSPSVEEAIQLLLRGGFTTTSSVSELSGRGIGLDVVRDTASKLRGEIDVRTQSGRGTSVEITVPVSLSSLPAVLVEAGGVAAALPLDSVPAAGRLREPDVARSPEGDSILYEGESLPLLALSTILSGNGASRKIRGSRSMVVVQSGGRRAALEVDRVLGTANVVVRALPSFLALDPVVAGAALDPRGAPQIVLDPEGIVRAASAEATARVEERVEPPLPILVIDDSLTTRMLEQSILESAGYQVELAVSGEDALRKARERNYGVFIVDVEMPGMDGFELVARTRADRLTRDTPAILVTSRASADDRKRGEEVGAAAYIVKSEFDQERLLRIIDELIR